MQKSLGFHDHDAETKQIARQKVFDYYKQLEITDRPARSLTLPSTNFIFEKMIIENIEWAHIDCIEKDFTIANSIYPKFVPAGVNYYYNDVFEVLKTPGYTVTYDLIWLDLCSNLSNQTINKLLSTIQNCTKKNSIFAVTIVGNREPDIKFTSKYYKSETPKEFREHDFPLLVNKLCTTAFIKPELLEIYKYSNTSRSNKAAPMLLYIFKIN